MRGKSAFSFPKASSGGVLVSEPYAGNDNGGGENGDTTKGNGLNRKRLLLDPWRLRLVHTSEIPTEKPTCVDLESGDPVTVRVLEINRWRHRIALSLRGASGQ